MFTLSRFRNFNTSKKLHNTTFSRDTHIIPKNPCVKSCTLLRYTCTENVSSVSIVVPEIIGFLCEKLKFSENSNSEINIMNLCALPNNCLLYTSRCV